MTRVLVTGGSGFIAAHILDTLLARGHTVVTTVRSQSKAQSILSAHPKVGKDKLDVAIVEDISKQGAFDSAVISDPPFEAVIHTASPYHFNVTDREEIQQMLDSAVIGTTGILEAIKKNASTVKRVVITSSYAAVVDPRRSPSYVFSEKDFNPITEVEAYANASNAYRASKTFAERAAWDFVEKEKPNFTLATCNPPLVFGPVVHYLNSLDAVNTSNQRIRDMMTGAAKKKCPPTNNFNCVDVRDIALAHAFNSLDAVNTSNQRIRDMMTGAAKKKCPPTNNFNCVDVRDIALAHAFNSLDAVNTSNQRIRDMMTGAAKKKCPPTNNFNCVDVRDIALAHALAMEKKEAAGSRFAITRGSFCNREIVEIIGEAFPELRDKLPIGEALTPGDYPEAGAHGYDNAKSVEILGMVYRPLKETVVDTVKSLQAIEGR